MNNGWIKLHRQLFENDLWLSEPFTKAQAWIDLFANANHEPGAFWVRGIKVEIERGQLGWSEVTMASRWRWSRQRVRRFLEHLRQLGQIEQQKNKYITSIITVINYDKYQDATADATAERQQKDSRRYINKNEKKNKNDKNIYTLEFEKFWALYPKKVGKQKSFTEWGKINKDEYEKIYEDIPKRKEDEKWVKGFIKDPERYIKSHQWEDEIQKPRGAEGQGIIRYKD